MSKRTIQVDIEIIVITIFIKVAVMPIKVQRAYQPPILALWRL